MSKACGIMHRRYTVCAPEDGRNYRPKHVELIGIINKPLLLHLVGCLYYCISDIRSYTRQMHWEYSRAGKILKENILIRQTLPVVNKIIRLFNALHSKAHGYCGCCRLVLYPLLHRFYFISPIPDEILSVAILRLSQKSLVQYS